MPEFVNQLNNKCQHYRKEMPIYEEKRSGPAHAEVWNIIVTIKEIEYGRGEGSNRKRAKEAAAEVALKRLMEEVDEV
ncbi:uncharacterized protein LACBIDRAFT_298977 [Laccaria bicolor S238N-H82]|uniref:Predicted protein n=1 Tax=Laccaria bicolor (strain S238N-H82 / ATCC MYA-4686) TaxID=486041 RepID=B0DDR5_LACBS|nr:uncharacterized protein LACBIDRAFT_298977 [Laccaria bicolor S238N-H82]EDR07138.1 predicted protein [Laccaria bicolor S238N-H82]|eukprot:XP_001882069.1 predicted protein [Laccaria bicolor S238N-H82]